MNSVMKAAGKDFESIPYQEASQDIWDKKYRLTTKEGEPIDLTMDDTYKRVARALADVEQEELREQWYQRFLWALRHGAIPAGRVTSNAGAWEHKPATSTINCTVSGAIHDSMDDILRRVHEAGLTLKAGCVAPGTWVYTDQGLTTADQAVRERHRRILCFDRDAQRFEMRSILRHMTTHVPREENIRITANGATLTTSIRHPVLIQRDGVLQYVRADAIRLGDAMVHHRLPWTGVAVEWLAAWLAGARVRSAGSSGHAAVASLAPLPSVAARMRGTLQHAQALAWRLTLKLRAAAREVADDYAGLLTELRPLPATLTDEALSDTAAGVAIAGGGGQRPTLSLVPVLARAVGKPAQRSSGHDASGTVPRDEPGMDAAARVPSWVSGRPERYFLPYLAGLLDTLGSIRLDCPAATLTLPGESLAAELQALLGLFGVQAALIPPPAYLPGARATRARRVLLRISDCGFLARVAEYMADGGKRSRIAAHESAAGQRDMFVMPPALRTALDREARTLTLPELRALGLATGAHRGERVSRYWLHRWGRRFPLLSPQIDLALRLRPVERIERELSLSETFYDFTVEGHNNYLAGNRGLAVIHNCGIGYEFSTLRPRGAYVSGAGAYTSGPLSFMDIYDKMCFTVSSAGGRRGAQMATFDVGHPDVMDFVRAKREHGRLRQFNLSLLISDEFMRAVREGRDWRLAFPIRRREFEEERPDLADGEHFVWREWPVHEGYVVNEQGLVACRVYKTLPARRMWDVIMSSTYDFAEPGFVLIDRVNEMNNNWWCENIRATNPCVTADTRLATQFGLVRIGDLYAARAPIEATVDRRALGHPEGGVTTRPAVPAFQTAESADVYRVVTEDGYEINATAWHDFYTTRGKIKLNELKVGDELLVQSGKGQFGDAGSAELGLLLGLLAGDGHFTNRGRGVQAAVVNLWGVDRDYAESVVAHVNDLVAQLAPGSHHRRITAVPVPSRNMITIRSVLLSRILSYYGVTAQTKLKVPEVVWRGSEDCVKGYLRGLFQADGTVNISGHQSTSCSVRLASSHPSLLRDVQLLLSNFGIFCRILKRREAGLRMLPDGKGGAKKYQCQADYELIIDGESRDSFMKQIGFVTEQKNAKYSDWLPGKVLRMSQRSVSRIAQITHAGREAVFDTTQSDRNTVIFNGLVTGQCGEQPLPEHGSCLLGSVNLTRFVREPFTEAARFDWDEYREVVRVFTRMLDNVVEINGLPLEPQRNEIYRKRRHGMGFLGLGSTLTLLTLPYGSPESVQFTEDVAREMALAGWEAGLALAREKGPAPIMDEEFEVTAEMLRKRPEMARDGWKVGEKVRGRVLHARYSRYMQRLASAAPQLVAELEQVGARFTHHSSIAPTGTISLSLANNASNGIEPSFAHHYFRNVIRPGRKTKEKMDVFSFELLAYRELVNPNAMPGSTLELEKLPDYFVAADAVTPRQHVDIQAAAQKWVDSSISKTANVPTDFPYEEFKGIYQYAYEQGLKGCTTFRFNPEAFQGVLVKEQDLKNTTYVFTLEDGSEIRTRGDEEIEYDGETHSAANLFDALKEGYYGKF